MLLAACLVFLLSCQTGSSQNLGDACVIEDTNRAGVCKQASKCDSARAAYQNNGIKPTFCSLTFDTALVCCSDGISISATPKPVDRRPVWNQFANKVDRNKRISERKCDEYSRGVTETVGFIPLLTEPETMSISAPKCNYERIELIVGGEDANQGEFPHMVPIKTVHKHPLYKSPGKYNDIALFELNSDVDFEAAIRPACLWTKPDFPGHTKAVATGWGVTTSKRGAVGSNELQKVSLSLLENDYCDVLLNDTHNRHWSGFVPSQMCAGELRGGKDTCQGDSGSPLQVASLNNKCVFHIVGITSFGRRCAESGKPAVYTRVSEYLDWIEAIVWPGE